VFDDVAFEPFLDHDERHGLSVDLFVDHFQKNVYKSQFYTTQLWFDGIFVLSFSPIKRTRIYRPVIISNAFEDR
jgi:hypothetical protein